MKILVGYDETRVAEAALKLAHKHARAFDAKIYIINSLEQSPTLKKEDIDKAESKLEKIKTSFEADGIACEANASVSYPEKIWSTLRKKTALRKSSLESAEDQRSEN